MTDCQFCGHDSHHSNPGADLVPCTTGSCACRGQLTYLTQLNDGALLICPLCVATIPRDLWASHLAWHHRT